MIGLVIHHDDGRVFKTEHPIEIDPVESVRDDLVEQPVQVGLRNWDWVEIREGLSAEQAVVISLDRVEVKAGARVQVEEIEYRP